jgi:hypothetical protein
MAVDAPATSAQVEELANLVSNASIDDSEDDGDDEIEGIEFVNYEDESQLESVMELVGRDLSEPYSSEYTYYILQYCDVRYVPVEQKELCMLFWMKYI